VKLIIHLGKCGIPNKAVAVMRSRNGKVLSGEDARPEEFPWMVSIKSTKGSKSSGDHFCGGFVINSRHIISAAHCFRKDYNNLLDYKEDGFVALKEIILYEHCGCRSSCMLVIVAHFFTLMQVSYPRKCKDIFRTIGLGAI